MTVHSLPPEEQRRPSPPVHSAQSLPSFWYLQKGSIMKDMTRVIPSENRLLFKDIQKMP